MKKKLLFVMESLEIGGAEKSLVTLLSQLDYSKYDVDLFLFNPKGEFLSLLPKEVNLLKVPEDFKSFILNPMESFQSLIKRKRFKLIIYKIIEVLNISFNRLILKREYIGWSFIKKSIDFIEKEYDVAVGFLEKKSIYFTIDKVKAKKKIGWIHTDYKRIEFSYKMDNYYLSKLNEVVAVSKPCGDSLVEVFFNIKDKVSVMQNIISEKLINKMSNEKINDFNFNENDIVICTVGRLTEAKGYNIAIECCERLIKNGLNFKWIVVGDGSDRDKLQKIIDEKSLSDKFILMGSKSNPYPYIKQCDIYVQPSKWEGFGITVAEAKVLNKPIIVSNIPEFVEQIEDNKTGLIYIDINDMVNKIEMLILNKKVRQELSNNLKYINITNNIDLENLEKLFE